jgi:hypothetical protein
MSARRRKSKQLSDTSAPSPPEPLTFIVDRCLGKGLVAALQARGIDARFLDDCGFSETTDDVHWFGPVGERGWVALSRDKKMRHKPAELRAIRAANLRLFLLQTKRINGQIIVGVFEKQWQKIEEFARANQAPFIAGVDNGRVALLAIPEKKKAHFRRQEKREE